MNETATVAPAGPQYMHALERANEVRLARAELKRKVAFGEIDVAEVILYSPWEAQSMAMGDLLMSQHRWGQTRCRKFLSQIPMSENKAIGSLTERQCRLLAAMLTSDAEGHAWSTAPRSDGQRPSSPTNSLWPREVPVSDSRSGVGVIRRTRRSSVASSQSLRARARPTNNA